MNFLSETVSGSIGMTSKSQLRFGNPISALFFNPLMETIAQLRFRRSIMERRGAPRCVLTTGNAIAVASGSAHSAVASALAHVAVTAVAIASGACLSTKVDFLWPRVEEKPDSLVLDGVDVTGYLIFNDAKVQKAIAFARKAHHGQMRKTGEPYLTHCIHTGKILAALVPASGDRAVNTVVAGILHDVIDDAGENIRNVEEEFGDDIAKLVAGVSRLSYINQLLRRQRRTNVNCDSLGPEEANSLRVMLLGMVDDLRVVLIKLADRLHNMRTIYALPPPKAQAVAHETLAIWCSLASRLGVWAVKAELEDLCFAVLKPYTFRRMQAELASMWSPSKRPRNLRRITPKDASLVSVHYNNLILAPQDQSADSDDNMVNMKVINFYIFKFWIALLFMLRNYLKVNETLCSRRRFQTHRWVPRYLGDLHIKEGEGSRLVKIIFGGLVGY